MTVGSDRSRLAALIDGKDRALLAAFLRDEGTDFALNPFPSTTAGAARLTCAGLAFEYPILGILSAGLPCLMEALAQLPKTTPLTRCILKSAAHTCIVFLTTEEACVGAYLHGKAGVPLPVFAPAAPKPAPRKGRTRQTKAEQLDLFFDVA
ncbi:UNVERIFIED_ORG: hypothetical protein M2438_005331 [Methylobacterium sp. SuP10 SLI 274]|uniref:hypothetical protein n=1 Tax=Methylorubrum extorquens TaxID=408 RepID=UPI00209C9365|nr:hypothetical protein [Methylorubrum extorquens]MDF9861083.1 hypothetical protein [Methylorubrum pseudosasae]MDH6640085.1 hypothetical protein [Methylobacterium sp. SuP10 SLI 274]MDH6669157.1 hypothetical protein [Methylorubrum zatmanii]MCP1556655.1 hypothetical protein [Methylorubrum extorquens]MDF9789420.1 hypothetical protein [Methylorubrum extorquens]